jgi:glycosyltransferase involved in cell wall biosynthesis
MIARALERVVERYGERVRIVFMGDPPPGELAGMPSVTHLPYVSNYECHAERLRGLGLDVALAPLVDTPFNHAKSNIKWLEYSACGIAGIYSDLPPYDSIRHGETGLKVANTEEAWYAAIATLIEHPELRERIAKNAQMEVVQHHSAKACKETFDRVYREALRLKARPGGGDR